MSQTYKPHNQSPEPAEPREMLPSFLDTVRSELTGQRCVMDRHDRIHHTKFVADIVACFRPANALETQLAQSIAADYWRLNRVRTLEEGIFAICHPNPTGAFGEISIDQQIVASQTHAFLGKQADFKFLSQYEMRLQRTINRNRAELRELQAERPQPQPDHQPDHQPDCQPPNDGFEFSNPEPPSDPPVTLEPAKVRTAAASIAITQAHSQSQATAEGRGFEFSTPVTAALSATAHPIAISPE